MLTLGASKENVRGTRATRAYQEALDNAREDVLASEISRLALGRGDIAGMTVAQHLVASTPDIHGMVAPGGMRAAVEVPVHYSEYGVILPLECRDGSGVKFDPDGTTTREALADAGLSLISEIRLPKNLQGPHAKHNVALMGIAVSLQHRSASLY